MRTFTKKPVLSSRFTEYETDRRRAESMIDHMVNDLGVDPYDLLIEFIAYIPAQKGLSALYNYADNNGISFDEE